MPESRALKTPPAGAHLLARLEPTGWLFLLLPALFLALFFGYPLARILSSAFENMAAWSWAGDDYVRGRVAVAFKQAVWSVVLTFVLAVPLAALHHRYRIRWSRAHLAIHAAPFILPVFVVVFGLQGLLGPHGWSVDLFGVNVLGWLGPLGTVVLAHAYYNYGFAARILHAQLERRPARLEEAARTLGASGIGAFVRVSLPLLMPSLAAVALLVFLFAFTSFGVVLFLGQGQVSTLETMLYQNLGGAFPRTDRAAVLGVLQLAINVALFLAYLALSRRTRVMLGSATDRGRGVEQRQGVRRNSAGPLVGAGALLALGLGMLPAVAVLSGGFRVDGAWSLEAWRALTSSRHPDHVGGFDLPIAVVNSVGYAVATLVMSLLLTLLLAYGLRMQRPLARRLFETISALPLGTSSLLIGLGFLFAFGAGSWLDLRGARIAVVVAHTLVAFPFTARVLLPVIEMQDRRYDEAAAVLGVPPWHIFWRLHVPLMRGPLLAAAGFALAMSLGDFGASLLLMRPDTMSLSVWIARHDVPFRDVFRAQATLLAGILMLLATAAYLAMEWFRGADEEVFG